MFLSQVSSALHYLHENHVVHGDLRAEYVNVLAPNKVRSAQIRTLARTLARFLFESLLLRVQQKLVDPTVKSTFKINACFLRSQILNTEATVMQGFSIPHKKNNWKCAALKALINRNIEWEKNNGYNRLHGMLEVVKSARFQSSKLHTRKMSLAKWDKFELQKCYAICTPRVYSQTVNDFRPFKNFSL